MLIFDLDLISACCLSQTLLSCESFRSTCCALRSLSVAAAASRGGVLGSLVLLDLTRPHSLGEQNRKELK